MCRRVVCYVYRCGHDEIRSPWTCGQAQEPVTKGTQACSGRGEVWLKYVPHYTVSCSACDGSDATESIRKRYCLAIALEKPDEK